MDQPLSRINLVLYLSTKKKKNS